MSLKEQTWFKYFLSITISAFFTIIFLTVFVLFGLDSQIWNQYGLIGSFRYLFINAFDKGYIYIFAIIPLSLILIIIVTYILINILPYYSKKISKLEKELEEKKIELENEYKNKLSYLDKKENNWKFNIKFMEKKINSLHGKMKNNKGRIKEAIIFLSDNPPKVGKAKSLLQAVLKGKR